MEARGSSSPALTESEELLLCGVAIGSPMAKWFQSIRLQLRDRQSTASPHALQIPRGVLDPAVVPLPALEREPRRGQSRTEHYVRRMYDQATVSHPRDWREGEEGEPDHPSAESSWLQGSAAAEAYETKVYRDCSGSGLPAIGSHKRSDSLDLTDKEAIQQRLRCLKRSMKQKQAAAAAAWPAPQRRPSVGLPPLSRSPSRRRKRSTVSGKTAAQHQYWAHRTRVVVISLGNVAREDLPSTLRPPSRAAFLEPSERGDDNQAE